MMECGREAADVPAWPEHVRVLGSERQLVGGGGQMGKMDLLGLVIEDGALDRALEELVRMAAEELIERVLTRDVQGEPGTAAAGTSPHLAEARHSARERHAERGIEIAHVDAEL